MQDGSGDGWAWKFDPSIWQRFSVSRPPQELLKETRCRIALFKGDKSIIWDPDVRDYMRGLLNRQVPFIEIPEARHHVMLDMLAFVAALRTLLQEWAYSTPTGSSRRAEAKIGGWVRFSHKFEIAALRSSYVLLS